MASPAVKEEGPSIKIRISSIFEFSNHPVKRPGFL
jgi:hypothetical protein